MIETKAKFDKSFFDVQIVLCEKNNLANYINLQLAAS